jgi:hypothetical protein
LKTRGMTGETLQADTRLPTNAILFQLSENNSQHNWLAVIKYLYEFRWVSSPWEILFHTKELGRRPVGWKAESRLSIMEILESAVPTYRL